jgi:hypothetical protein
LDEPLQANPNLLTSHHPIGSEERPLGRVSKDGPRASWFETALKKRLLTMRDEPEIFA